MSDLQLQQYLFDVQGYLVIENVLSPEEVAALNQCIDEQQLPTPGKVQRFGSAPDGSGFSAVGETALRFTRPFQRLCRYFNSAWAIAFDSTEFMGCICGKECRAEVCMPTTVLPLPRQERSRGNTTLSGTMRSTTGSSL